MKILRILVSLQYSVIVASWTCYGHCSVLLSAWVRIARSLARTDSNSVLASLQSTVVYRIYYEAAMWTCL